MLIHFFLFTIHNFFSGIKLVFYAYRSTHTKLIVLFKVSFSSSSSASSVKLDGIKFQKLILLSTFFSLFLYSLFLLSLSVCDVHPSNYKYGCILHGNIEVLLKILLLAFIFYVLIWILHIHIFTAQKSHLEKDSFFTFLFVVSAIHHGKEEMKGCQVVEK